MQRIDQVVAGFADGDAISTEARILQSLIRGWGVESEIFADPGHVAPEARALCRPLDEYGGAAGDVVMHHYSIDSPAVQRFVESPARRILVYHNITPSEFFRGFDDRVADQLERARSALRDVLPRVNDVWAVSGFNAAELEALGAREPKVFPLLFAPDRLDVGPDPYVFNRFTAPMSNWLFVGRVAPNKRIEDLILAFAWYHRTMNRQSRLVIVGSERSCPRYYLMLRMLAAELGLVNVCFERFASPRGLSSYYDLADVFVTASGHEGYCLPLVEAMHKNVPVIARRTGGIPEALGGGGVLFDELAPAELAALIERVLTDAALREEILASQARRIEAIHARDAETELRALLGRDAP